MDKTGICSNSRNTTKTDLSLLLECLKLQMKCPDLQKQALLTIHSICEKREDNVDLVREMGGVAFLYNLCKSRIVHADVKESALFTICTLAEANVYCKNSLCRKETFADIAGWLMKEDISLTQQRVSVYLLSVLVANNKLGQTLAQTTGCLDILLDLFRTTFPLSTEASLRAANATQTSQLWASVSSALCGCVNNPQNEEGQKVCVTAFPMIKTWLQQIGLPRSEIFQPICSFIAMTVANNPCVQESFSASGGLDTLTLTLVHLASAATTSLLSCQLSVIISKTLSACISDNTSLASGLAQHAVVSHLLSLLASPHLDPEDRLSVLLTVGHCTGASEKHQTHLVQGGGLPLVITVLAEDTSEEVRKAATFILQTCKQATLSLVQGGGENLEPLANMESFRSSARELLRRIDLLEKRQAKETADEQEDTDPSASTEGLGQPSVPQILPLQKKESVKTIPMAYRKTSALKHAEAEADNNMKAQTIRNVIKNESDLKNMSTSSRMQEVKAKTSGGEVWCSVCESDRALVSSHLQSLEGDRDPHTANDQLFNLPARLRHSVPKEITSNEESQDREVTTVGNVTVTERSLSHIRCGGCVLTFETVNSRTFASLQSSCHHSCDMHMILREATERFRTHRLNLLLRRDYQDKAVEPTDPDSERASTAEPQTSWKSWKELSLTPVCKGERKDKSFSTPARPGKNYHGISLTPLQRGAKKDTSNDFTPLKRSHLPETAASAPADTERRGSNSGQQAVNDETTARRKRRDFSREEVHYLLCGMRSYGFSPNTISPSSYPFHPGRTDADLAKKHRRLTGTRENLLKVKSRMLAVRNPAPESLRQSNGSF